MSTSPAVDFSQAESTEWKQEISARVQAHRSRRQSQHPSLEEIAPAGRRHNSRAAGVAATVAERYAAALSYSEYLSRIGHLAEGDAHADNRPAASSEQEQAASVTEGSCALQMFAEALQDASADQENPPLAVAALPFDSPLQFDQASTPSEPLHAASAPALGEDFLLQVMVEPDVPMPSKLIEFPRQLVAARRARPRLAEGPLRQPTAAQTHETATQLRIFEVEEENISRAFMPAATAGVASDWHYIQLDTPLLATASPDPGEDLLHARLEVAPIDRRLLALAFDVALISLGLLAFALAFVLVASQPPSGRFALISAVTALAGLSGVYHWLFLTLSNATPGMRYARIALCTFHDENPGLSIRRSRLLAAFLSTAVAGLGFVWAWFDHDRLSWHDRMSRTYQRCY